MRHLHALGRSLASSAIALLSAGLCAPAGAQPSYRASHDGAIAEFAPPRRESFDRLIVQLPPLVPVRRSEKSTAAPTIAAAAAPAAPAARDAAPSVTPARADAAEAKPAAAPTAPVEAAEAPVASAASAVAVPAAPLAIEPAESHSAPADAAVESAPVAQEPEAPAAAAPEAPAAEELKTDAAEAIALSAEAASGLAAAPAPARLLETADDRESGGLGWAALVIVALLALGGFVAAKRMKARREKAMSVAEPASRPAPAAPAPRLSRVAGILGMARAKLGPALRALLQRLRNRRGDAKGDPAAEPQAAADWARIGATLRARANAAVDPVVTPAAGESLPRDTTDTTAPRAEARRWEQDREDGVELLEPGSVGARSLVMNARRKLQAAGER